MKTIKKIRACRFAYNASWYMDHPVIQKAMNTKDFPAVGLIILLALVAKKVPAKHIEFDAWQTNLVDKVNSYSAGWDLSTKATTEWTALTVGPASKKSVWEAKWAICAAKDAKPSQTTAMEKAFWAYKSGNKNDPNDVSIQLWLSRWIRKNPLVTDDQKVEMGLLVPDDVITPSTYKNAKLSSELTGKLKSMKHLSHTTSWFLGNVKTKVLPKGLASIDIYTCITLSSVTTAPDPKEFDYSGQTSRGEFIMEFDIKDECKKCWYYAKAKSKGRNGKYGTTSPIFYIGIA